MDKNELNNRVLQMWVWALIHDMDITEYLRKSGKSHVAIYGFGAIGECLYYDLINKGIVVDYIIDRNKVQLCDSPIYSPYDRTFPTTDVIIVTVEYAISEITELLTSKTDNEILSFQQLLCHTTGLVL